MIDMRVIGTGPRDGGRRWAASAPTARPAPRRSPRGPPRSRRRCSRPRRRARRAPVRRRGGVARGVQHLAAEPLLARPGRLDGRAVVAAGDHHLPHPDLAVVGRDRRPRVAGALQPAHLRAEPGGDAGVLGVAPQVLGHVVLGDPPPEAARDRQAGQGGLDARRVQVQPLVPPPPGVTDALAAVDHQRLHAPPPETGGHCQSRRSRAHDQHVRIHRRPPPRET